jgi:two-component system, OmpR family, phosphate regulon sensor histidine kinase PhoR
MLSAAKMFEYSQTQIDHNRLISLINSLSDGFLAVGQDGKIELSNGVALSLLDTNSLNGKTVAQAMPLLDKDGQVHDPISLIGKEPNLRSRDLSLKYRDGGVINLYINISAVRSGFGSFSHNGYVILFRDITKEKLAEDERDEFISVASHELRNPVAIAEGSLSNAILLSGSDKTSSAVQQVLKSAHEQIIFLSGLINDLAMVSRADRTKLAETAEEFDPTEIIKSLQEDYQTQAAKKGLELAIQPLNLPKIYGSRLYTREILQNFITNAIKYTEKGKIEISAMADENGVHLSVTDSGIGIDEQEQQKLFGKFFRSEDSRVRNINGTGLGLYVSRKLAKLMGGSISMTSELDKGSIFTLNLPLSIKVAEPVAK